MREGMGGGGGRALVLVWGVSSSTTLGSGDSVG